VQPTRFRSGKRLTRTVGQETLEQSMQTYNPIDLLFGGMEKLGPGGNAHTLHVLRLLPTQRFHVIVDAGCGAGRQTMVLAQALGTLERISF
jgi:hypothetical protein